jgi:hypothetical protein
MNEPFAYPDTLKYTIYLHGSDWKVNIPLSLAARIEQITGSANTDRTCHRNCLYISQRILLLLRPFGPGSDPNFPIHDDVDYAQGAFERYEEHLEAAKSESKRQGCVAAGVHIWIM